MVFSKKVSLAAERTRLYGKTFKHGKKEIPYYKTERCRYMKEELKTAFENIQKGDIEAAVQAAKQIKQLSRTSEGIFDLILVDADPYEAARWIYPVYAAFESECNKKEGYPDILAQVRVINQKLKKDFTYKNAAATLDMLIHTIDHISPEVYEYYRELVDIFKDNVREVIKQYYASKVKTANGVVDASAEELFCGAVARACREHILLAEKYQAFC